ncbi:uncharacterized protein LOC131948327 [Physella acuta]|uniref:uncharacterized protein LOC131948327 n=1 Tax=Physella acuta TaxID=109671 RepID=UPI0027DE3FE2|nr:uncharacterized protein LOC131948327 [Physella acuta]
MLAAKRNISHLDTGYVAAATDAMYLWGPNPVKTGFTYEITFLGLHTDSIVQIRYLNYRSGRQVEATYEAALKQNTRTVHRFVSLPGLKDLAYFVIEMVGENNFDYVAMTYDANTNYGVVRSVPPSFWSKHYGLKLRPSTVYWKVLVLSLVSQRVSVTHYEAYLELEGGYRLLTKITTDENFDVLPYQPYLFRAYVKPNSFLKTHGKVHKTIIIRLYCLITLDDVLSSPFEY